MKNTQPSVAEALSLAHAAFLEDLRDLEEAACSSSGDKLAELHTRLGATHAHVSERIRFEEQNGYVDVARKRGPRLERTIQHLGEEHCHRLRAGCHPGAAALEGRACAHGPADHARV